MCVCACVCKTTTISEGGIIHSKHAIGNLGAVAAALYILPHNFSSSLSHSLLASTCVNSRKPSSTRARPPTPLPSIIGRHQPEQNRAHRHAAGNTLETRPGATRAVPDDRALAHASPGPIIAWRNLVSSRFSLACSFLVAREPAGCRRAKPLPLYHVSKPHRLDTFPSPAPDLRLRSDQTQGLPLRLRLAFTFAPRPGPHGETPWGRPLDISYPQITPIVFEQTRLAPMLAGLSLTLVSTETNCDTCFARVSRRLTRRDCWRA